MGSPVDAIFDFPLKLRLNLLRHADRLSERPMNIDRKPAESPDGESGSQNPQDAVSMSESVATDGIRCILQHVILCPKYIGFSMSESKFHALFARLSVSTHSEKISAVCCSFAALPRASLRHICYEKKLLIVRKTVAMSCVQVSPVELNLSIGGCNSTRQSRDSAGSARLWRVELRAARTAT